jgi:glycine/D-amino acid oxidase-like deaminating enzyme
MITAAEIRELMPELQGSWRAALYTPEDAHAEPVKATRAFATAAELLGARFLTGTPVLAIDSSAGAVTGIITPVGRHRAGAVLLAGGADSGRLARTIGVDLPIQVIRSSVAETARGKPFTRTAFWGPKLAFRPRRDGSFYLGNGYRGAGADYDINFDSLRHLRYFLPAYSRNWRRLSVRVGRNPFSPGLCSLPPEPKANPHVISHNHRQFHAAFPHLGPIGLARSWAGRIDLTPDLMPIISACGPRNFYVTAGFSGHGFALAPVIGRLAAELTTGGNVDHDLHPFRQSRFKEGDIAPPSTVL